MSRVLVIDDEPSLRMVLDLALSGAGHEAVLAENGLKGLEKLDEGYKPDLVLVDLKMPKLSGKDFVMKLRSNPNYNDISVVILSGAMPGFEDFPPNDTYQGIISKPFDLNELLKLTESLCCTNDLLAVI